MSKSVVVEKADHPDAFSPGEDHRLPPEGQQVLDQVLDSQETVVYTLKLTWTWTVASGPDGLRPRRRVCITWMQQGFAGRCPLMR